MITGNNRINFSSPNGSSRKVRTNLQNKNGINSRLRAIGFGQRNCVRFLRISLPSSCCVGGGS